MAGGLEGNAMGAVSVDVGETAMFPFWLRQHLHLYLPSGKDQK
jgi:hypothetical protein